LHRGQVGFELAAGSSRIFNRTGRDNPDIF
jgi:hypothetical protein